MTLFFHIIFGAAIVSIIKPVWLAFLLALLSHYFLDAFPHWEYSIKPIKENSKNQLVSYVKVFTDFFLGFVVIYLSPKFSWQLALGGFLAIFPDGISYLSIKCPLKIFCKKAIFKKVNSFHRQAHFPKETELSFIIKIISPFAFALFSLCLLF